MASCRFRKVCPRCRRLAKGRKGPRMRKEATLPIAERMENVSFAGISIDPGEDIALPEAARRTGLVPEALASNSPRPLKKDHARPFAVRLSESAERRRRRL
jgi:hypothetical protein